MGCFNDFPCRNVNRHSGYSSSKMLVWPRMNCVVQYFIESNNVEEFPKNSLSSALMSFLFSTSKNTYLITIFNQLFLCLKYLLCCSTQIAYIHKINYDVAKGYFAK